MTAAVDQRDPDRINFDWLIRLRWAAIGGQLITIAAVHFAMQLEIPIVPLLALVGTEVVSNVGCTLAARRARPRQAWLAAVMALDVLLFSGLLYLTGGPNNPFSFLYLIPIALASITMRPAWTWALVGLSLACSGVLFATYQPLALGDHSRHMSLHLRGMWVAFGVAASFIVYFLLRVRRALERHERELDAARAAAQRQEQLASLATLAAGAAHELLTPLSTIAVIAGDLQRDLAQPGGAARASEDARLVRAEVERCRAIIERMRADAGDTAGEGFAPVAVTALVESVVGGVADARVAVRPEIAATVVDRKLTVPPRAVGQALSALIENAQQASPPGDDVVLRVAPAGGRIRFEISDRGAGMPAEVLARVGEPFFTTKPAGRGMGLGVFLARAVADRLGGELTIRSAPGSGTSVVFALPLDQDGDPQRIPKHPRDATPAAEPPASPRDGSGPAAPEAETR
jgi:two-component system sensor histidine kinase RegB